MSKQEERHKKEGINRDEKNRRIRKRVRILPKRIREVLEYGERDEYRTRRKLEKK